MGYYVEYELTLTIGARNIERALEIFNNLHTPEMLQKYARGGAFGGGREEKWYSWVPNPPEPYRTLQEAFANWAIVDDDVDMSIDRETGDFTLRGSYNSKLGQQDFLIEQLAPVLRDARIDVKGEDGRAFAWIVENHQYREE
jgi:hypothetical protein